MFTWWPVLLQYHHYGRVKRLAPYSGIGWTATYSRYVEELIWCTARQRSPGHMRPHLQNLTYGRARKSQAVRLCPWEMVSGVADSTVWPTGYPTLLCLAAAATEVPI